MSTPRKKRPKPKLNSLTSPSLPSWAVDPSQALLPSKQELFRFVTVLVIASSVAIACNYFVKLFNPTYKPFCDSSFDSPDYLADSCQPCPSNGECYQGKLECLHGYRKHGNLCIEDGDINETAKKLVCFLYLARSGILGREMHDLLLNLMYICFVLIGHLYVMQVQSELVEYRLCKAYAQVLCGGSGSIWVQEDDISKDLDEHELMKNFESKDAIYFYTKKKTMDTISSVLESRTNSHGIKEWKCPDLLAANYKPFSCHIRQWAYEHALIIVPVCALLVGCTLLLWKLRRRWYLSNRVEELYRQVCEILEENALMSKSENDKYEPWIVASQLRDHLLLPKERKNPVIWKKVEDLVQEDSRVDQYPKLLKGESKVVWEWQVEGSLSSSRTRKKGEANKLKSPEDRNMKFSQQHSTLKAETKALIF